MRQTATTEEAADIMSIVGDAKLVAEDLSRFREAAQRLSSDHPRFIEEFPQKWVAVTSGAILAADSLEELLEDVDGRGIDRQDIIVRYIDDSDRILIL
jgi:hypothetical protein